MSPGGGKQDLAARSLYMRGLQASVRNNATAYGYSVMITGTTAILVSQLGAPSVGQIFMLGLGAVAGFVAIDGAATRGFRERARGEPADVVVLGSAMGFFSVGLGLGAAALSVEVLDGDAAWPVGAFLATIGYLLVVGIEMALAERAADDG